MVSILNLSVIEFDLPNMDSNLKYLVHIHIHICIRKGKRQTNMVMWLSTRYVFYLRSYWRSVYASWSLFWYVKMSFLFVFLLCTTIIDEMCLSQTFMLTHMSFFLSIHIYLGLSLCWYSKLVYQILQPLI